ncbi:hypothetical protein [Fluviicola sp.]|jgi:hypothetical protein|uniref:hypothetical protein n=1 Tax=Fluviicola sp. TaxID=1917219 RepID=UPI0028376FBC|nr:hypothetical protein [Fluviicola sp.]MDR0802959.1 hypothetical protein [Fluviicola sp.]
MKNLKVMAFIGLGFMMIQSCSKQSELCDCTDMATELMKGDREHNYDGTFQKKYVEEHKAEEAKCRKIYEGKTDKASQDKIRKEMKECRGYGNFKDETIKSMEHLKKQMPELSKEIDKSIEQMKAE